MCLKLGDFLSVLLNQEWFLVTRIKKSAHWRKKSPSGAENKGVAQVISALLSEEQQTLELQV